MEMAGQREQGEVSPPPNWGTVRGEVRCPLCGYELRGLVEPRCPECGHEFAWGEVLDPERQVHRYLFEHHPERNMWSFWRTAVGTWRPGRFWRELRPAQPSRGRRLVGYWGVTVGFVLVGLVGMFGLWLIGQANQRNAQRAWALTYFTSGSVSQAELAMLKSRYGSIQGSIDASLPAPSHAAFYWQETDRFWNVLRIQSPLTTFALGAYVAWPWVTIGGLMVFQVSMRRARVRPVHVVRCALYSFDGGVWIGLGMVGVVLGIAWPAVQGPGPWMVLRWTGWVPWAGAGMLVVSAVRLGVAYRRYARMDHAWAVVASSQVMAVMAAASVLFAWDSAVRQFLWVFE